MKSYILWGLLGLNVILLCIFVGQFARTKPAQAQAVRRPADYIMIPGEVQGAPSEVVYIIDSTNSQLGAMVYDDANRSLTNMPPIDLSQVFSVPGAGGVRGTGPGTGANPGQRGMR